MIETNDKPKQGKAFKVLVWIVAALFILGAGAMLLAPLHQNSTVTMVGGIAFLLGVVITVVLSIIKLWQK